MAMTSKELIAALREPPSKPFDLDPGYEPTGAALYTIDGYNAWIELRARWDAYYAYISPKKPDDGDES
jgi:hypothetical protein